MNTATEETGTTEEPKATKKARVGAPGAHIAPKKGKTAKKASPAKKAPKAAKEKGTRDGSKAGKIIDLLKRVRIAFEREQAFVQDDRLAFQLDPEQFDHRTIAEIRGGHARLLFTL